MKKKIFSILFALVLVLSFSLIPAVPAMAIVLPYYVATTGNDTTGDGTEGNPWATIQYAVDQCAGGETINVAAGTYDENVTIDKALTLNGANAGVNPVTAGRGTEAIINGGGTGDAVTISADDVTIEGFEITNGTFGIVAGARSGLKISNNMIHHNVNPVAEQGCGITIWAAAGPCNNNLIENNVVYSNERQGIFIGTNEAESNSTGNTVRGNKVYDNGTNGFLDVFGIQFNYASGNTIENNEVYGHTAGYSLASGIYLYNANNNNILDNNLHDNKYGICQSIPDATVQALEDNEAHFNNIVDNTDHGARNFTPETQLDAKNNWWGDIDPTDDVRGNVDYSPWWGANYVGDDHSSAWTWYTNDFIQDAIDDATAGDTINVAAGTYTEAVTIDKGLTLEGANAGVPSTGTRGPESIIDAVGTGKSVIYIDADDVTIDGFTVKNAEWTAAAGGNGIVVLPARSGGIIINNIAEDNSLNGIDLFTTSHHNTVRNNTTRGHEHSGIVSLGSHSNTIEDNLSELNDCGISLWSTDWNEDGIVPERDFVADPSFTTNSTVCNNTVTSNNFGIRLYRASNNTIENNDILNNNPESLGLKQEGTGAYRGGIDMLEHATDGGPSTGNVVHFNNIVGNNGFGISNTASATLDATNNWWGDATGADPDTEANNPHGADAAGDKVTDNVDFTPWYATATTTPTTQNVSVDHPDTSIIAYSDTIQGGIDAALAGDTINVAAGTYDEQVSIDKNELTLQSTQGRDVTIIDAGGDDAPQYVNYAILIDGATGVTIDGFTLQNVSELDDIEQQCFGLKGKNGDDEITAKNIIIKGVRDSTNPDNNKQGYAVQVDGRIDILNMIVEDCDHGISIARSNSDGSTVKNVIARNNGHGAPDNPGGFDLWIDWMDVTVENFTAESDLADGTDISMYITGRVRIATIRNFVSHSETEIGIQILGGFPHAGTFFHIIDSEITHKTDSAISMSCSEPPYYTDYDVEIAGTTLTDNSIGIDIGMDLAGYAGLNTWGPPSGEVTITGCDIHDNDIGIIRRGQVDRGTVKINFNNIYDDNQYGVKNELSSDIDATNNWWDNASGPTHTSNPGGTGDEVSDNVDYTPWTGAGVEEAVSEDVSGTGGTIPSDQSPTGGDVTVEGTGIPAGTTVTTVKYEDNPGDTPTFEATGDYYDVHLSDDTGVDSLIVEFCPADEDTVIYYWNGASWVAASDQEYDAASGCIVVTITDETTPSLEDLTGLVFGLGTPPPPPSPPPPVPPTVGGEVYPINKAGVLAPWLGLALILAIGGSIMVIRRRRAH